MAEYKLTYFHIRGLGEPVRLIFALANVPYEDIRIPHTPPALGMPSPIPDEIKQKLPFGQMPILEFGDVRLSQTRAICRFLAKKFNFYGGDDVEAAKIDELVDAAMDYFEGFRQGIRGAKNEEEKSAAILHVMEVLTPKYLGKFCQILEANGGTFFVGNCVSWADVIIFHMVGQFGSFTGVDLARDYPALDTFVQKFSAIPNIKRWLEKRPESRI